MADDRRLPVGTSLIRVMPELSVTTFEQRDQLNDEGGKAQNDALASSAASCVNVAA
jgi:hypothetical protein